MKTQIKLSLLFLFLIILSGLAIAAEKTIVPIHRINEIGVAEKLGTIRLEQTRSGIMLTTNLKGFAVGKHAFHIHQNPDCSPGWKNGKRVAGLAAGSHYMRQSIKHQAHHDHHHGKPHGDLTELVANDEGKIINSQLITQLSLAEIKNRSMIIHHHGENEQGKSPGGGERYACGVIPR